MFKGCSSLSDINAIKNWDVSNGNNFGGMLDGCSTLSEINALKNWNVSNGKILNLCSKDVHHYQI